MNLKIHLLVYVNYNALSQYYNRLKGTLFFVLAYLFSGFFGLIISTKVDSNLIFL